ncbi:MAG: uroporphyrinogen decarboxylase [Myxococcota bacterium]|nr:uroporphyrinogen decarboxylase [Myxococcota bacterium]
MNDLLLRALASEPVERPPVWFMRQAGRYLPEYHTVRNTTDFLGLCRSPELAAEVTLQPLRRFKLDASIVFNDILVPAAAMGMDLRFVKGTGPVFSDPIRMPSEVSRLKNPSVSSDMPHVLDTIRILVEQIDVPLFGFAGAPFTLAAYMIEGGGSKQFLEVKRFMFHYPEVFAALLDRLADIVGEYLQAQVDAGCSAVQLFDTWAGCLSPEDYRRFALPAARKALASVSGVPRLYFTKDSSPFLPWLRETGADALALDWRTHIGAARSVLGDIPVMGNLDPILLYAPPAEIRDRVHRIIQAAGARGHVFNLGHGVLPTTPIEGVEAMVAAVREWRWSEQG